MTIIPKESGWLMPDDYIMVLSDAKDIADFLGVLMLGVCIAKDEHGNEYVIIDKGDFEQWYGDI